MRLAAVGGGGPVSLVVAVGTLSECDYPYAPGVSRQYGVTLGLIRAQPLRLCR
jgi:hypothetical protein